MHTPIHTTRRQWLAQTSAAALAASPWFAQAQVPGAEVYEWNALFAPAGTPDAVLGNISAALQKALDAPAVYARIAQLGGEIPPGGPEAAQKFVHQQIALWARVVKERGVILE